jgi:hypothetical protein
MDKLFQEMGDSDEKIRNAAAFALGGVVAGSVGPYFLSLLKSLQSTPPAGRSLILHAIKEVVLYPIDLTPGYHVQFGCLQSEALGRICCL